MENMELNVNEMEEVLGGFGGSRTKLPEIAGCLVYKIVRGDKLGTIARKFNTTVKTLKAMNSTITNENDITAGYYIYVPKE